MIISIVIIVHIVCYHIRENPNVMLPDTAP